MSDQAMLQIVQRIFAQDLGLLKAWFPMPYLVGPEQTERALWWAGPDRSRLQRARDYLLEGRVITDAGWSLLPSFVVLSPEDVQKVFRSFVARLPTRAR